MNNTRVLWGIIYFLVGVVLISCFAVIMWPALRAWVSQNHRLLIWSAGWSAVGIGLGLLNSRNDGRRDHLHYVTYFVFVFFVATLAALATSQLKEEPHSYIVSTLTGIAVGFSGDSLAGIISKLSGRFLQKP